MGRFNISDLENYGGNGGSGFFSLANDKDVARVRIMWNTVNDIEAYAVHEVEVNGRKRYVSCLRNYDDPIDKCPLCKNKSFQRVKLYIPLYDIEEDRVKYWERGKKFAAKLTSLFARYSDENTPLVSQIFEIERNGKKGSTDTTYEIYPIGRPDGTTLEDLPEATPVLGSLILDKTAEELEDYLETGSFPTESNTVTRKESYNDERVVRRTPIRRNTDRF